MKTSMRMGKATHVRMMRRLFKDKRDACDVLGMNEIEYFDAVKDVRKMPVVSLIILCDIYNKQYNPKKPIQLSSFEQLLQ